MSISLKLSTVIPEFYPVEVPSVDVCFDDCYIGCVFIAWSCGETETNLFTQLDWGHYEQIGSEEWSALIDKAVSMLIDAKPDWA